MSFRRLPVVIGLLILNHGGCGRGDAGGSSRPGAPAPAAGAWSSKDIGAVGQPGGTTLSSGTFTVSASGTDIWDAADAFQFVSQPLHGDGELHARVLSLGNTDAWAKAGVMIRETLDVASKFAMTVVTPGNGTTLQYRTQTAQGCGLAWGPGLGVPVWVRITRQGDTFSGAVSPDGTGWTSIGSVTIPMAGSVYVGLCVTAHNNAAVTTAVFDSVSLDLPSGGGPPPTGSVSISTPVGRIVYQRNNANWAALPIRGSCSAGITRIDARVLPRSAGQGTAVDWTMIDGAPSGGSFRGSLAVAGGWYSLELRAWAGPALVASATLDRVGVGEVFAISGHSVAAGGSINIDGANDDRVSTTPLDPQGAMHQTYNQTGDPQYLPQNVFVQFGNEIAPAPFGGNTYFWAKFGEYVAQQQNVPVLIYNAAFGGTSLEHWAKSSQGIWFPHTFVNASIRMPYINVYNVLKTYVPLTGIRAVLCDHGQNDWPEPNEDVILQNYQTWVNQARADLGHGSLAMVINRQTPTGATAVRHAQDRMSQTASCFVGPDYDTLAPEDRSDGIHLSASGEWKAAMMWANALNGGFFSASQPYLPSFP
jgi:hypothetical protein